MPARGCCGRAREPDHCRQADAEGKVDSDRAIKQLAVQGPELLKRVAAAREIYEELKKTAAKERIIRAAK